MKPKKDYTIGICSVKEEYYPKTLKLIEQIGKYIDVEFVVLTDSPSVFGSFSNVHAVKYERSRFSFHDKLILVEEGMKYNQSVLILDADHSVRESRTDNLIAFDSSHVEYGAYPQIIWRYPSDCSMQHFLKGATPRVPYGKEFKHYCKLNNYKLKNSLLIQESFLFIKETPEKIDHFLKVWKDLRNFCEQKDIERDQHILGYGEGYSIGVSLNTAGIKIDDGNPKISDFAGDFKHFAWEPE